jgi:hypothetical protein
MTSMQRDMIGVHQYPFSYVIENYGVPARMGRIVSVDGRAGVIAADRGHYIGVNFDDSKPGVIHNCHPTDKVEYLGIGKVRKLTRAQERYKKFLDVAECYDSFPAWLGIRSAQ